MMGVISILIGSTWDLKAKLAYYERTLVSSNGTVGRLKVNLLLMMEETCLSKEILEEIDDDEDTVGFLMWLSKINTRATFLLLKVILCQQNILRYYYTIRSLTAK